MANRSTVTGRPSPSQSRDQRGFYAEFFGFRERPFTLLPDPTLLFWSKQYRKAFSVLEFGVLSGSPITLLTGGIGCGKTTLLREFLAQLDASITVGLISNAQGGRGALIQWVMNALGMTFDHTAGYVHLFQAMQDFMVAEYAAGHRTLLIFDEAQNLSQESLEELRMLTNINTGKDEVVQLVLIGQPELRAMIRRPGLEQLAQRIAVSFHLETLDAQTTGAFIMHRLRAVGGSGAEFTEEARHFVFQVTRGVPRLINQFCDMALLYAWTVESPQITPTILSQVLEDNIFFAAQVSPPVAPPLAEPSHAEPRPVELRDGGTAA
ncbi:MAG: AAA family ATPase [Pseudorhodobacter sp.]|nr:AAA family ATPase [Pseudorhodobacter sp.]